MKKTTGIRIALWSTRLLLLPVVLYWLVVLSEICANYWRGGIPGIEFWFYWHVLVLGVPVERQTTPNVLHLAHRFYLEMILLLTFTEILAIAQWYTSRLLKRREART